MMNEFIDYIRLRCQVFIIEQGFKPGWEPDEDDKNCTHFGAYINKKIIGTIRFRELKSGIFKIERMAIDKKYRGRGVGGLLLSRWVRCQAQTLKFYQKNGFEAVSKPYLMYGTKHIDLDYVK